MRTTNLVFKVLVQEHIIECMQTPEGEIPTQYLKDVVEAFKSWYSPYEQKRTPNHQDAFIDWLQGLPSELSVEYSSFMICETLKYWFTHPTVDMNFIERHADKEAETYYNLVYREFRTLCTKYKVEWSL
jgi:hypothetical protein